MSDLPSQIVEVVDSARLGAFEASGILESLKTSMASISAEKANAALQMVKSSSNDYDNKFKPRIENTHLHILDTMAAPETTFAAGEAGNVNLHKSNAHSVRSIIFVLSYVTSMKLQNKKGALSFCNLYDLHSAMAQRNLPEILNNKLIEMASDMKKEVDDQTCIAFTKNTSTITNVDIFNTNGAQDTCLRTVKFSEDFLENLMNASITHHPTMLVFLIIEGCSVNLDDPRTAAQFYPILKPVLERGIEEIENNTVERVSCPASEHQGFIQDMGCAMDCETCSEHHQPRSEEMDISTAQPSDVTYNEEAGKLVTADQFLEDQARKLDADPSELHLYKDGQRVRVGDGCTNLYLPGQLQVVRAQQGGGKVPARGKEKNTGKASAAVEDIDPVVKAQQINTAGAEAFQSSGYIDILAAQLATPTPNDTSAEPVVNALRMIQALCEHVDTWIIPFVTKILRAILGPLTCLWTQAAATQTVTTLLAHVNRYTAVPLLDEVLACLDPKDWSIMRSGLMGLQMLDHVQPDIVRSKLPSIINNVLKVIPGRNLGDKELIAAVLKDLAGTINNADFAPLIADIVNSYVDPAKVDKGVLEQLLQVEITAPVDVPLVSLVLPALVKIMDEGSPTERARAATVLIKLVMKLYELRAPTYLRKHVVPLLEQGMCDTGLEQEVRDRCEEALGHTEALIAQDPTTALAATNEHIRERFMRALSLGTVQCDPAKHTRLVEAIENAAFALSKAKNTVLQDWYDAIVPFLTGVLGNEKKSKVKFVLNELWMAGTVRAAETQALATSSADALAADTEQAATEEAEPSVVSTSATPSKAQQKFTATTATKPRAPRGGLAAARGPSPAKPRPASPGPRPQGLGAAPVEQKKRKSKTAEDEEEEELERLTALELAARFNRADDELDHFGLLNYGDEAEEGKGSGAAGDLGAGTSKKRQRTSKYEQVIHTTTSKGRESFNRERMSGGGDARDSWGGGGSRLSGAGSGTGSASSAASTRSASPKHSTQGSSARSGSPKTSRTASPQRAVTGTATSDGRARSASADRRHNEEVNAALANMSKEEGLEFLKREGMKEERSVRTRAPTAPASASTQSGRKGTSSASAAPESSKSASSKNATSQSSAALTVPVPVDTAVPAPVDAAAVSKKRSAGQAELSDGAEDEDPAAAPVPQKGSKKDAAKGGAAKKGKK